MRAYWEQGKYPLSDGDEICARIAEDVRKKLWIMRYGQKSNANLCLQTPTNEGLSNETGWWANGSFRNTSGVLHNYGATGLSDTTYRGPGWGTVWHDDGDLGPYNVYGMTLDYHGDGKSLVWIEDDVDGTTQTIAGQLQVGVPLKFYGDVPTQAKGFWRIKSRDVGTEAGYILLEMEDFAGGENLEFLVDYDTGTNYTSPYGGSVICDFGGDWYTFCPNNGSSVSPKIENTLKHYYADNVRGDGETMRPPDGGRYSVDRNLFWIRGINPYIYHHYDPNAHRWYCFYQRRDEGGGDEHYFAVIPSWKMLPICTDPREQVPPHWYNETMRTAWELQHVEIEGDQLNGISQEGPMQKFSTGYDSTNTNSIYTNDQYHTQNWDAISENFFQGWMPLVSDGETWNKHRGIWRERKMETVGFWPYIEMMAKDGMWVAAVDAAYKENWLNVRKNVTDPVTLSGESPDTYYNKWYSGGWNLAGYRPKFNNTQPTYAPLYDYLWGENGSAIEWILREIGLYDWWYDTTTQWMPDNVLPWWADIAEGIEYNSESNTGTAAFANVDYPEAHGIWRRVPRYSFTQRTNMRQYEAGAPDTDTWDVTCNGEQTHLPWIGRYNNAQPIPEQFVTTNLAARHTNREKSLHVMGTIIEAIDKMIYRGVWTSGIGIAWVREMVLPATDPPLLCDMTGATMKALHDKFTGWLLNHFPDDMENWEVGPVYNRLKICTGMNQVLPAAGDWVMINNPWMPEEERLGLRFTNMDIIPGYAERYFRLSLTPMGTPAWGVPVNVLGVGNVAWTQDADKYTYMWFRTPTVGYDSSGRLYWEIRADNHPLSLTTWSNEFANSAGGHCEADLAIVSPPKFQMMVKWDWDNYANVFRRDKTFANFKELDPMQDNAPPFPEPTELYGVPIIYDANRHPDDIDGNCYTWANYVAEWRIRLEAYLQEDLEGNGEFYEYEGSGGSGTKIAEDFEQSTPGDRVYDEILDMDTAASPGDAEDLEAAAANNLHQWEYRTRCWDDASAAGAGQTDNATEWSEKKSVHADVGKIVPPLALWDLVPQQYMTTDVLMSAKVCFGPVDDRICEYMFETTDMSWIRSWNSSSSATHAGGWSAGKTYRCCARTVSGNIITLWSVELAEV